MRACDGERSLFWSVREAGGFIKVILNALRRIFKCFLYKRAKYCFDVFLSRIFLGISEPLNSINLRAFFPKTFLPAYKLANEATWARSWKCYLMCKLRARFLAFTLVATVFGLNDVELTNCIVNPNWSISEQHWCLTREWTAQVF